MLPRSTYAMLCYLLKAKVWKCTRSWEWEGGGIGVIENGEKDCRTDSAFSLCVGCHWLPHPYLYLLHTTRQHFIERDWNVIFVWWQINYGHFSFFSVSTRSHHLFAEHANQKHTNPFTYIWCFQNEICSHFQEISHKMSKWAIVRMDVRGDGGLHSISPCL